MKVTRALLLDRGVRNLREFGYLGVTSENIVTDSVYRAFFRSMLVDNKETAGQATDVIIDALIAEIDSRSDAKPTKPKAKTRRKS